MSNEYKLGGEFHALKLTLLDFLILDVVQRTSFAGLGFERRKDSIQEIQSEIIRFHQSQKNNLTQLKKALDAIHESPKWTSDLLKLIENNEDAGFFYLKSYVDNINTCVGIFINYWNTIKMLSLFLIWMRCFRILVLFALLRHDYYLQLLH